MPSASQAAARPLIVAHRGASADAPENTLAAFELAWEQGADAIEGDFHLTRDYEIVCIHNSITNKSLGKKLTIRKTRLADLRASHPQIPTLAEVFQTIPAGKKLYIEIKSSQKIIPHLFKQIDASEINPSQLVIIAFSQRVAKKIKIQRSNLKVCWLTNLRHSTKGELSPTPQEIIATLKSTGVDGVSTYAHADLDADFVDTIRNAGYEFHVWTVDDLDQAKRLGEFGVQSITTNTPASLLP